MMGGLTARRRRYLGLGLLAYGLAGLLLLAVAGAVIGGAMDQLIAVGGRVGEQRDALLDTLRATSQTMRNASSGVGNVGESLDAARESADHAAGLARSLGTTLHDLAAAMSVQIFGTQPLAGLASGFDRAAGQSDELAGDLDQVAAALGRSASDLETSRQDLAVLSERVDVLVASVETVPFGVGQDPSIVKLVLTGLLVWLALPAFGSIGLGVALMRSVTA